jgi:Beta-glucan synthesis-associated protein SKN1/KRE6/Sbg1/Glycosyl hydrolases family 16
VYNEFYGKINGPEINGVYGESPRDYVQDSLSVNTPINGSLFESQHVYRLEWQPRGYIDWYLDGVFLFGIPQESITAKTGALIPVEPMYMIANIAMGTGWGINENCDPDTCGSICNVCMDCHNPECQCTLPEGMKDCKMFPVEMKIDYFRIYQDPSDPAHTFGCSPEGFPTEGFIEGNAANYMNWEPKFGFGPFPEEESSQHDSNFSSEKLMKSMVLSMIIVSVLLWMFCKDDTKNRYIELHNSDHHCNPNLELGDT